MRIANLAHVYTGIRHYSIGGGKILSHAGHIPQLNRAVFDTDAVESGIWKRNELKPNSTFAEGEYSGVYFTFDESKKKNVQYKKGVS